MQTAQASSRALSRTMASAKSRTCGMRNHQLGQTDLVHESFVENCQAQIQDEVRCKASILGGLRDTGAAMCNTNMANTRCFTTGPWTGPS